MKEYSRKCPIDFKDMFYDAKLPSSWEKLKPKDIFEKLPYEGFFQGSYTANQLLALLDDYISAEDKDKLEEKLRGCVEETYRTKWNGYPEAEEARILFRSQTDKKRICKEAEQSDIKWFAQRLKTAGLEINFHPRSLQIRVSAPNGDLVMILLACCPKCFTILPSDWFCAEDYISIALLAPRAAGKTTLMASWMCGNNEGFEILNRVGHDNQVGGYQVLRAVKPEHFKIQNFHNKNASRLCDRYGYGSYPEKAADNMRIPPVYFKIIKNRKSLLIGVYDCLGEVLEDMANDYTAADVFLSEMDCFIYMAAPESMRNVSIPIKKTSEKEEITLLTMEEQAKLQSTNPSAVSALELIGPEMIKQGMDPWWIYHQVRQYLDENELEPRKRHVAYTMIHSDEICDLAEVKAVKGAQDLFQNPPRSQILDENYLAYTNYVAKNLFGRLVFEGTEEEWDLFSGELEKFCGYDESSDYVSWHCISAAYYDEQGFYRSIRKMDPLIGCIHKKLKLLT